MKKTALILLGAGAPLAWGGPSTSKITSELFKSDQFLTTEKKNLAEYVRNCLAEFYQRDPTEFNFEYIINALESLSDYFYEELSQGGPPQFTGSRPTWFSLAGAYNLIENFEYSPINDSGVGLLFNLATPGNTPPQVEFKAHKRFYIMRAIEHYLSIIRSAIARYDYTDSIQNYENENQGLIDLYIWLKKNDYTVRFYTTNYDDLIPTIFSLNGGINLYRGFDEDQSGRLFPNIKKILTAGDTDCYFNLHGSIYWQRDMDEQFEPSFLYSPGQRIYSPYAYGEYTNPSEHTVIYNIITGFNKLQKVSVEPLKAYFTSLSNDAINADFIATIGYSYGDTHINRSLSYGIKYNNAKFLHVTKSDNFFGSAEYIYMQRHMMKKKNHNGFSFVNGCHVANDNSTKIYTNSFKNFLSNQEWQVLNDWI